MSDIETTWIEKLVGLRDRLGREPDLNEMLALARTHKMTPAEHTAQRESYGRGEAGFGSDADEAA